MVEKPPTKSSAHRIGLVPCGSCNAAGLAAEHVTAPCAWCWDADIGCHTRFIPVDKAIEWAREHGMDEQDLPTPAEHRRALETAATEPPDKPPDTEPVAS